MQVKQKSIDGTVEILTSNEYQAFPVTVAGTTVVKAGMPIKEDGTAVPAGTGADGILLYDVDPNVNPNGAAIYIGAVDWEKCQDHSGATATAATMRSILPAIKFRTNCGVTPATTESGGSGGGTGGGTGGGVENGGT